MISREEINNAKSIVDSLNEDDYSLFIIKVDNDVETRALIAGDSDDVKNLMERVEVFASNYNSNK